MILGLANIFGGLDYLPNFQFVWAIMPYHINDVTQMVVLLFLVAIEKPGALLYFDSNIMYQPKHFQLREVMRGNLMLGLTYVWY